MSFAWGPDPNVELHETASDWIKLIAFVLGVIVVSVLIGYCDWPGLIQ